MTEVLSFMIVISRNIYVSKVQDLWSCLWNVILLLEMDNIIKILILFGKYNIHKAKYLNCTEW